MANKATAKTEAMAEDVTVNFNGQDYTVLASAMDNIEILEFIEDEQYFRAIRATLGVDSWKRFKDSNRDEQGRVTAEVFQEFVEAVFGALGN